MADLAKRNDTPIAMTEICELDENILCPNPVKKDT